MKNRSKKSFTAAVCIALAAVLVAVVSGCSFQGLIDWYKPAATDKPGVTVVPDTTATPGVTETPPPTEQPTDDPEVPPATEQPTDDPGPGMVLADYSWTSINTISQNGAASSMFAVGDEKNVTLSTGEVLTFVILGFDHDDLAYASGNAGITFGMKDCMAAKYAMNDSRSNVGGWANSVLRVDTLINIFGTLPEDLQTVIKQVAKQTSTGGGSSAGLGASVDRLFLLSEVELNNSTGRSIAGEGTQYEYYEGKSLIDYKKYLSNGAGDAAIWYLRSAQSDIYSYVVYSGTALFSSDAQYTRGISFCFCV